MTGLAGLFSLVVAAVLLWLFAPMTLGGSFGYVTVTGNSMSPLLDTGDLVFLRKSADYEVGDAVAYRHPQIGTVLHRIVADDGQRFTLRGDNRAGEDTYQPTADDVIGREWVILPSGGKVIRELQQPRNLGLLVAAVGLLLVSGGTSSRGPRGRLRLARSPHRPRRDLSVFSQTGRQLAVLAVALAIGSLVLFALVTLSGTTREVSEAVPFSERGTFSYGGPVAGGVYDDDRLRAPEPLYRQLVDTLPLRFDYDLSATEANGPITEATGTYELVLEVGTEDGWTRTYPLQPSTPFANGGFAVEADLDLAALEADLAAVAERTGIASTSHVIRVVATVQAVGRMDGLPFETNYRHYAQFRLAPLQLRFDGTPDALSLAEARTVSRPVTAQRTLNVPMLPFSLRYAQFPLVGALGLLIAAALAVVVAKATLTTWSRGEAARIRAAYDALLVEIAEERASFGSRPQDVSRFEDLVRLARAEGLAIMHRAGRDRDEYFVATADRSWRYAVSRSGGATLPLPIRSAPFRESDRPADDSRHITTTEG